MIFFIFIQIVIEYAGVYRKVTIEMHYNKQFVLFSAHMYD